MDELPIAFGLKPELPEDGMFDKSQIDDAVNMLVDLIWHHGGFRFRKRNTRTRSLKSTFYCAQDRSVFTRSSKNIRDRSQMERYSCCSKLIFEPFFEDRTLRLEISHNYHCPYVDIQLSEDVQKFVVSHSRSQSPSEIYQNIQELKVPGFENVAQSQIYYLWHKISMKDWKRHDNQMESAKILLKEKTDQYFQQEFTVDNIFGMAFYINSSISTLAQKTKELAIDATYGTNSAGCDLFAVLAEFDGTGVPVAYLFVQKSVSPESAMSGVPGTMTKILEKFLRPLRDLGFNPSFFGCDKDKSEINAIQQVWPTVKVQLCFWHAKRAIKTKLKDYNKADSLASYIPDEAKSLVPELEICWGSYPKNRTDQNHK